MCTADDEYVVTVLALLGKLGISMSYCVCWMHAVEMYPTNIRSVYSAHTYHF